MRRYELGLVIDPTVPEPEHDKLITGYEEMIAAGGGEVLKVDRWGRRKLAYQIKKFSEGNYTFILFDGEPGIGQEIERRLKLSENVLRFLTVRADHEKPPTTEEQEKLVEQRREHIRRAEEAAAAAAAPAAPAAAAAAAAPASADDAPAKKEGAETAADSDETPAAEAPAAAEPPAADAAPEGGAGESS